MKNNLWFFTVLIGYGCLFLFNYSLFSWVFFMFGLVLGGFFHYLDYLLYPFYSNQQAEIVKLANQYWQSKNYQHYLQLIFLNQNLLQGLLSRSLVFLVVFFPLAVVVLTTSSWVLGKGVVLGLGLKIAMELFVSKNDLDLFNQRFVSGHNQSLDQKQISQIVTLFIAAFIVISIFAWL